jgi:hypothetical protein
VVLRFHAAVLSFLGFVAGCAAPPAIDGLVGRSAGTPTLEVSGAVDPAIELTFHVEYVATGTGAGCTRIDGESGRVVATRWLRYAVPMRDGRYALAILLDPRDETDCGFEPRTVYFWARDVQSGKQTEAYVSLLSFADDAPGGRNRLEPQFVDCQESFGGGRSFDCSLPRTPLRGDGPLCTVDRRLNCASGCTAEFDFRRVDPPRREALWAVPEGCPTTPRSDSRARSG